MEGPKDRKSNKIRISERKGIKWGVNGENGIEKRIEGKEGVKRDEGKRAVQDENREVVPKGQNWFQMI